MNHSICCDKCKCAPDCDQPGKHCRRNKTCLCHKSAEKEMKWQDIKVFTALAADTSDEKKCCKICDGLRDTKPVSRGCTLPSCDCHTGDWESQIVSLVGEASMCWVHRRVRQRRSNARCI
jgi:hypothetical protein